jgi:hypothetical protein
MKTTDFIALMCAVFGLGITGVIAIIVISYLRPNVDNTLLIIIVLGFLTPTLASLIAVVKGFANANAIRDLHVIVNSRLTELLQQTSLAANLAGREAVNAEDKAAALKKEQPSTINTLQP